MNNHNTIEINGKDCNIQGQRYILEDGVLILEIEYSFLVKDEWKFATKKFVVSTKEI